MVDSWYILDDLVVFRTRLKPFGCVWRLGRNPQGLVTLGMARSILNQDPMVTVLVLVADLCYFSCYVNVLVMFIMVYLSF